MPSTLYQSVKKSVIQFAQIRKKNQKVEDKLLFKWKLITLGLSIVFIVLIGTFSQILKLVNSLPDVIDQKSFILPIIKASKDSSMPTVVQAANLVQGITYTLDNNQIEYAYNSANLLYDFTNNGGAVFQFLTFINKINNNDKLVFIFSTKGASVSQFALFSYHQYVDSTNAVIMDSSNSLYSTFFSLEKTLIVPFQASNCALFRKQPTSLLLFQSVELKNDGTITVGIKDNKYGCFQATDLASGNKKVGDITNVDLTGLQSIDVTLDNLQVYSIYLNDS